jgi:hypothetical protein
MSPDILTPADLHDRLGGRAGPAGPEMSGHRCHSDAFSNSSESAMNEWMSLLPLGSMILQAGVKFLYEHAAVALKRKFEPHGAPHAPPHLPPIFDEVTGPLSYHIDKIEALEEPLRKLSQVVSKWANGAEPINPANTEVIMAIAALRLAMEQVFQQRLTFKGERRSHDGLLGQPLALIGDLLNEVLALKPLALGQGAGSNSGLINLRILGL